MVSRDVIKTWLSRLRQSGFRVCSVRAEDGWKGNNLLPPDDRIGPSFKNIGLNAVLIALVLSLAAAAWYLPLWKQQTALSELHSAAERLRSDAEKTEDLNLTLQSRIRHVQELMDERRSSHPIADIVLELTNLHSDASSVRFLKITDGEIVLEGETRDSATLVERLEKSPMFEGVELRGPVVQIKGTFYARYRLRMRLEKAGPR